MAINDTLPDFPAQGDGVANSKPWTSWAQGVHGRVAALPAAFGAKADAIAPTSVKTAAYTAVPSDIVPVDASTAPVPITLPPAPSDKSRVTVKKIDASSNAVTIATSGSDVLNKSGGSTSVTLQVPNQAATFQYAATPAVWYLLGSDLPLSQLDLRFAALSSAPDPTIPALENAPAFGFGHSFLASVTSPGPGADTGGHALERVAIRNRTQAMTNRAAGGTRSDEILASVIANWTPNTRGVVMLGGAIRNDQNYYGNGSPNTGTVRETIRSILAHLTSRLFQPNTDAAFAFGSGWSSGASSTGGSYVDFAFNGDAAFLAWTAVTGTGGVLTVTSGSTTVATINTGGFGVGFRAVTKLAGLGAGSHTLRATLTSGSATIVGLLIPSATPPLVVWQQETPYNTAIVSGGATANTVAAQYVTAASAALSDFGYAKIVTVDTPPTWDATVDCTPDGVHPSSQGHRKIADRAIARMTTAGVAFVQGLNWITGTLADPTTYTTPAIVTSSDTTPPTVPGTPTATGRAGGIDLSWTGSTDNVAVTGYRIYRSDAPSSVLASTSSLSYADTSATPGTAYTYTVDAYDAAGNASAKSAASASATASASTDTTAPTVPGTPTATAGAGSNSLTWSGSTDNVAVTGYRVYRSDAPTTVLASPSGTTYTDTTPVVGTAYTYTVAAFDAAGNLSAKSSPSNSVTATSANFVNDTFTDTSALALSSHTGEQGATWAQNTAPGTGTMAISNANRARQNAAGVVCYYTSAVPASGDYTVEADLYFASLPTGISVGIAARMNTTANTGYLLRYAVSSGQWQIAKYVAGTGTVLATFAATPAVGETHRVKLVVTGTTLTAYIDGVQQMTVTDSSISIVGRAALFNTGSTAGTDTTSIHVDNFAAHA